MPKRKYGLFLIALQCTTATDSFGGIQRQVTLWSKQRAFVDHLDVDINSVRVTACGICGTDLHWNGTPSKASPFGHEVADVGSH